MGTTAAGLGSAKTGMAIVGVVAAVAITGGTIALTTPAEIDITQTTEKMYIEAGEKFSLKASDFLMFDEEYADMITIDMSEVDTLQVGEYEVIATCEDKEYVLTIFVRDTTAPTIELNERVFYYTKDSVWGELDTIIAEVSDLSEVSEKIIGYEYIGDLTEVNREYVATLTDNVPSQPMLEGLTEEIPTESGVYRMVIIVEDAYGNATYEEVYIVFGNVLTPTINVEEPIEEIQDTITVEYNKVLPYTDENGAEGYIVYLNKREWNDKETGSEHGSSILFDYMSNQGYKNGLVSGHWGTESGLDELAYVYTLISDWDRVYISFVFDIHGGIIEQDLENGVSFSEYGYTFHDVYMACKLQALSEYDYIEQDGTVEHTCTDECHTVAVYSRTFYYDEMKSLIGI